MNFFIKFLLIFHHRIFTKFIYYKLRVTFKNTPAKVSENSSYLNILNKVNKLIDSNLSEELPIKSKISGVKFIKTLKVPGKGSRIALINFTLNQLNFKTKFHSKKEFFQYRISLCQLIEAIHNLSLVVDDILDNDTHRRNRLCVHVQYGLVGAKTVIRYWLDIIFTLLFNLQVETTVKERCFIILEKTCNDIIKFVEKEIYWKKNKVPVNWDKIKIEEIEEIYFQKTVRIFLLGIEFIEETFGTIKNKNEFLNIISKLGLFLQRANDLENFNIQNPQYLSDLRNKRVILVNFHDEIEKNESLKRLRHLTYNSVVNEQYVLEYGNTLLENKIIEKEIIYIEKIKLEVTKAIEFFNSKYDVLFLELMLDLYSRKLKKIKDGIKIYT